MGSVTPEPQKLWVETPVIPSLPLSKAAGCNIFLKLENLQPSGSFKSRGVGNMMYRAFLERLKSSSSSSSSLPGDQAIAHFYCSSGGNAGLACATAAATLSQPCTIVVPTTTSAFMIDKLRAIGAEVVQVGESWAFADKHLREELMSKDSEKGVYVPPFDHPHVWEGASYMMDELVEQIKAFDKRDASTGRVQAECAVDGIVCCVGGGGLFNGIMAGVERHAEKGKWRGLGPDRKPLVLAVETKGADSLDASVKAGELVTLPGITSIANSLGAITVSRQTFEWSKQEHFRNLVVSDKEAVTGLIKFADDARMLVEVACGATICPVYNGDLRKSLGAGLNDAEWAEKNIVLIVCGGSNISLELIEKYRKDYNIV